MKNRQIMLVALAVVVFCGYSQNAFAQTAVDQTAIAPPPQCIWYIINGNCSWTCVKGPPGQKGFGPLSFCDITVSHSDFGFNIWCTQQALAGCGSIDNVASYKTVPTIQKGGPCTCP